MKCADAEEVRNHQADSVHIPCSLGYGWSDVGPKAGCRHDHFGDLLKQSSLVGGKGRELEVGVGYAPPRIGIQYQGFGDVCWPGVTQHDACASIISIDINIFRTDDGVLA